jgi:hypothetical protein
MCTSMSPESLTTPVADPAAAEQSAEVAVQGDADDDLGGVDAAGEVQQRRGGVFPGDGVVAAATVLNQLALGFECLRGFCGDAVCGAHMDGEKVSAADALEDPGGPADQSLPFGAAGEADDNPFPGRPAGLDPLLGTVLRQALIHPVGEPEQGQLPQGCQVAEPEVVGQGGIDLVGRTANHPGQEMTDPHHETHEHHKNAHDSQIGHYPFLSSAPFVCGDRASQPPHRRERAVPNGFSTPLARILTAS